MTQWPRGLVEYVPSGSADGTPDPEEDRDLNRLRLAARLAGFARSRGQPVDSAVAHLREAEAALRRGERARARRLVDDVLAELERVVGDSPADAGKPSP